MVKTGIMKTLGTGVCCFLLGAAFTQVVMAEEVPSEVLVAVDSRANVCDTGEVSGAEEESVVSDSVYGAAGPDTAEMPGDAGLKETSQWLSRYDYRIADDRIVLEEYDDSGQENQEDLDITVPGEAVVDGTVYHKVQLTQDMWWKIKTRLHSLDFEKGVVVPDDCSRLFAGVRAAQINLSNIDFSEVTDMTEMFRDCGVEELDLSTMDTSGVTSMAGMFRGCGVKKLDLSTMDTSNVTSMAGMFRDSSVEELDLSTVNTDRVTDMQYMFSGCFWLKHLDVSGFDTSNVTDMQHMFENSRNLETINLSGFDTGRVVNMSYMFATDYHPGRHSWDWFPGLRVNELDLRSFDTSHVRDMSYMFKRVDAPILGLEGFDTSNVTNMAGMFSGYGYGDIEIDALDLRSFDTSSVTNMNEMFRGIRLTEGPTLEHFDTSHVTQMEQMFYNAYINPGMHLEVLDTSSVTTMKDMFAYAPLKGLNLSFLDTSSVKNMEGMFEGCDAEKLDLSSFDTSNLEQADDMFASCSDLEVLDLGECDFSNVAAGSPFNEYTNENLTIIFAPVHTKADIMLPFGFYDEEGNTYDRLPRQLEESITLYGNACGRKNPSPFQDVRDDSYAFMPVLWAASKGITAGTSADRFDTGQGCTRAQIVTMLWRAEGCPTDYEAENPFTDVTEDKYYYQAVLWAVSRDIVKGVTETRFAPDAVCTRAQALTLLWRSGFSYYPNQMGSGYFRDVPTDCYYDAAVGWAVAENITAGTGKDSFSPGQTCTRGQIVTFLYRMH